LPLLQQKRELRRISRTSPASSSFKASASMSSPASSRPPCPRRRQGRGVRISRRLLLARLDARRPAVMAGARGSSEPPPSSLEPAGLHASRLQGEAGELGAAPSGVRRPEDLLDAQALSAGHALRRRRVRASRRKTAGRRWRGRPPAGVGGAAARSAAGRAGRGRACSPAPVEPLLEGMPVAERPLARGCGRRSEKRGEGGDSGCGDKMGLTSGPHRWLLV
jgi:hypothetical protein